MSRNKPNFVFVFADQLRYDLPGYAGGTHHVTPNLDALSSECVNFTQAVSSNPVCGPYRACLFTGRNCTSNGMVINEIRFNPHQHCLGNVLTENGYRSAYIGKWHLYSDELRNFYATKNSFTPKGEHRLGFDDYWAAYGFSHNYFGDEAFYHLDTPERVGIGDRYMPDVHTDLAIDRMKYYSDNDLPFALFLSYSTPHGPWRKNNVPEECYNRFADIDYTELPPNYSDDDDPHGDIWAHMSETNKELLPEWKRIYDAMSANVDENIGRLVTAMREYGLDKNTIFIFTSDHGECFGSHGRRQKSVFYEEAARVPFLMRLPNSEHARSCDACISTVDIMPTLLGLAGLPIPPEVEGSNLAGLITEKAADEPEFAFMQGTGSVAIYADGYEWRALRDKRYTYGIYRSDRAEFLFDNQADPYQIKNLIGNKEFDGVLRRVRSQLDKHMKKIGDNFPLCSEADESWIYHRRVWRGANECFDPCPFDGDKKPADEPVYADGGERFAFYPIYDRRESYTVADGVTTMMDYVFYGAYFLKEVVLPKSLRKINAGAFAECGVEHLDLPESLKAIEQNAFYRAKYLKSLRLPRSLEKISTSAFDSCPDLTLEVYPDSVGEEFCKKYGTLKFIVCN